MISLWLSIPSFPGRRGLLAASPVRIQTTKQILVCGARGQRLVHYDDIQTVQPGLLLSKRFSNHAFNPVAPSSLFAIFFGNREPQSRELQIIFAAKHRKPVVAASHCLVKNTRERRRILQPLVIRKPLRRLGLQVGCCFAVAVSAADYGVSFARPLARRRFITRRPALVAMRARNPCVRARFNLLG